MVSSRLWKGHCLWCESWNRAECLSLSLSGERVASASEFPALRILAGDHERSVRIYFWGYNYIFAGMKTLTNMKSMNNKNHLYSSSTPCDVGVFLFHQFLETPWGLRMLSHSPKARCFQRLAPILALWISLHPRELSYLWCRPSAVLLPTKSSNKWDIST